MAEQFRTLADYHEKAGHAQGAQLTRNFGDSLLEAGLISESAEQFWTLADYLEKAGHAQGAQLTRNFGDSLLEAGLISESVGMEEPIKMDRGIIESRLEQIAKEFNSQEHTPGVLTQTFQAIWQARGELVGATYEVTPCPYTQEKIAQDEANGVRHGYLPTELSTQQTRHILGEMSPKMQSQSVKEGNSVTNDENPSGWFDYEAAIDAPYLETEERQLMDKIKKDGRKILSLNQYIVAREDSKLFTGKYLDEDGTYVRVGSRNDGYLVSVYSRRDGRLRVGSPLLAGHHYPRLGGRSSGVNKA